MPDAKRTLAGCREMDSRLGGVSAWPAINRLLAAGKWAMPPGERAACEGILSLLQPSLSIEIGTATGGSLEPISAQSREVHAFDLERRPELTSERFPNVTFHVGDSHELLSTLLQELAAAGRNVDFALVDGDHSARGARQDVEDLLASPCVGRTVILLHDTLNASVRAGLEQVDYDGFDKVRFVDLDFVQGRVLREGPHRDQLWSGLGLVVTGADFEGPSRASAYPAPDVYEAFSSSLVAGGHIAQRLGYEQLVQLERHAEDQRRLVKLMERSWSWRVTAPLRRARTLMRRRRSER